jgi:putative protease
MNVMVELLSPVGDFECLKAAVQNGANAVYFAAKSFGARAFASNFDDESLENAINYAKLRNVKTNLTLNTLIKENEFKDAINLAEKAYKYGIDAIIVQDLGLALELIKRFPDLDIHSSTQMTVHNLEGVIALKELGFKRVVLSRELSYDEIKYICENTDIEIEVFVHGALCISYSGQCLFSSMIGGRSGNRGKCAQTCRLPYELLEEQSKNKVVLNADGTSTYQNNSQFKKLDKGYLLSTRDLCSLEYLPKLIEAGVTSFKIEGRMKNPEYVATVTRIYRKYIDLALNENKEFVISQDDKTELLQVFNRGCFSDGHLDPKGNQNLVFKEKQNNMGIYLGTISKYNKNKGLVTCTLQNTLSIGDSISFENENTKYTISELLDKNQNIKTAKPTQNVTFGRMKGNINIGDKIYKISDKSLTDLAIESFSKENIKNKLECKILIRKNQKIGVEIICKQFNIKVDYTYDYIPQIAQNASISKEKILCQFNKILDTEFEFSNFEIELDDNLFIPVSILNDVRRLGINMIREKIIGSFKKEIHNLPTKKHINIDSINKQPPKVSLLLTNLNLNYDYTLLENVDKLYIPLKYFGDSKYLDILNYFSNNFNLYIYMPTIIRKNYVDTSRKIIENSINKFNLKGIVISNLSQLKLIPLSSSLDLIGNYTLNIYNTNSIYILKSLNIKTTTISPELDENGILSVCENTPISKELIVYGKIPVMTMNYCVLGNSNKCYKDCKKTCNSNSKYFIKDRMGILFRVIPDNIQTISTIYNSKTTSIEFKDFNINFARIDILDENIKEINNIIYTVKTSSRFEGKNYTNGNIRRNI